MSYSFHSIAIIQSYVRDETDRCGVASSCCLFGRTTLPPLPIAGFSSIFTPLPALIREGLCACVTAQEIASAQNNTDVDMPPTAATTCPVPSAPPKDAVGDPVCSLCPEGMVLDPAMKDVAPQQEYAAEIAKALAQAGQSEFIPIVLSFVTCGCGSLENVFRTVTFNSFLSGIEGVEEQQCVLFQQFLGSGEFPGGPEGCCKNDGEGTSSGGVRSTCNFCWKKEGGNIFGRMLSFGMLVALSLGAMPLMI